MFLLNNIYNRNYSKLYPGIRRIVFDLDDDQLSRSKNADWKKIAVDSIVCVINDSRKVGTFYRIEIVRRAVPCDSEVEQNVIIGRVAAKLDPAIDMESLLNRFGVSHPHLNKGKFTIGFNVADLGGSLDELEVKVGKETARLGTL